MNNKGRQILNSLWIIVAFVWLINWAAFLYVGIKAKNKKWIVCSVFYCLCGFVIPFLDTKNTGIGLFDNLMWLFFISWITGIVHAFLIRKKYLKAIGLYNEQQEAMELDASTAQTMSSLNGIDQKRLQDFYSILHQIKSKFDMLQVKAAAKNKLLIVARFLEQFKDEISSLDQLFEKFRSALAISNKYSNITAEIMTLEQKAAGSNGEAREFLLKAIEEKKEALQEFENIKKHMETSESKLLYILSIMDKIELIMESFNLGDDLAEEDTDSLNSQLSVFSDNLKGALDSMKI